MKPDYLKVKNIKMDKELKNLLKSIFPVVTFVAFLWLIHIFQVLTKTDLTNWGILPRTREGLWKIFLGPLVHSGWQHLISNSAPFLLTGVLMETFYPTVAKRAFMMIYLFTGCMVWFFARDSYHVGASGVVYGMVSFLLFTGVFRKSKKSVYLSLTILLLYSGLFAGVVPMADQPQISWESHLYGALVGGAVALYFRKVLEQDELQPSKWEHVPYEKRPFFLSRDVFTYTKAERQKMEEERRRAEEQLYLQRLWEQQQQNGWNSDSTM
jgi:membrane associated rhomboid family serine protease